MSSKVQKPCKICAKMFTPCADCENDKVMFHWRRVACSPECAKEYFTRIEKSRISVYAHDDIKPTITNVDSISDINSVEKVVTEETKVKRTKKKNNIINGESEQID